MTQGEAETKTKHFQVVRHLIGLRALNPAHVRKLLAAKSASGLSVRSVQIIHAVLRVMLAEAVRDELVERNVATIVRATAGPREEVRPWSPDEANAFLAASGGDRLHALFAVGVALGLRRGELLGLRWADVDLDCGLLHVRQSTQRIYRAGLVVGPPKTPRSRRDIPLPAVTVKVLQGHRSRQAAERLAMGPYWQDSGLVFTSTIGNGRTRAPGQRDLDPQPPVYKEAHGSAVSAWDRDPSRAW